MDVRYTRQINLSEIGLDGQRALAQARVLVVGAGGLGAPVLYYLTAMGVGHIGIIDDDVVSETNLQRQILYTTEQIGQNKVNMAIERLKALNPLIDLQAYHTRLNEENVSELIPQYDIIVDACDNYPTRLLMDTYSAQHNIPYIYGSVEGFEGQLSVFNTLGAGSYRDFAEEVIGLAPNRTINVLGALPGVLGSLQAMEVVKLLVGCGTPLVGKLLSINLLNNSYLILDLHQKL